MLLPDVERALADPQAPADIAHLFPTFHPLQGSNNLLFRVRFLRHLPLSSIGILEGRSPKITPAPLGLVFGFWVTSLLRPKRNLLFWRDTPNFSVDRLIPFEHYFAPTPLLRFFKVRPTPFNLIKKTQEPECRFLCYRDAIGSVVMSALRLFLQLESTLPA